MALSIPATRTSDGLRPIDISRDLPQVIELLRLVFGESLDGDEQKLFGAGIMNAMNGMLFRLNPSAARLGSGFVWQADGRIVGNATLLKTKARGRYLVANVAVHPSHRRQGIARALMQTITSTVKERGGKVIILQVVKDNLPARDLYLSLGYRLIGNMSTWYATASRVRYLHVDEQAESDLLILPLPNKRWREAYLLDTSEVHADLNWPEPLPPDVYYRTLFKRASDFMNGRQMETWTTTDARGQLAGLATINSEWGRSHLLSLRVRSDWRGRLERPLLAKLIRRLHYLPRRNVRIDHPEDDEVTGQLLKEANFTVQRTLTHMRLDLSQ
jgi:ribosomal protein S18 acetylase RimI-like enzyme